MFTEPMEQSTFHFCGFFNWGAKLLDTAATERIHLRQEELTFGKNGTGSLEGLQQKKSVDAIAATDTFSSTCSLVCSSFANNDVFR